jgi:hypothetical protein
MGAHVLLPLAVNNISERKVDSPLQQGLEPMTFDTQAHLSLTARPSPTPIIIIIPLNQEEAKKKKNKIKQLRCTH